MEPRDVKEEYAWERIKKTFAERDAERKKIIKGLFEKYRLLLVEVYIIY